MGPQMAENEAAGAACAPRFGPPAAPKKSRTKGHSCPGSLLRIADWGSSKHLGPWQRLEGRRAGGGRGGG
eukprot:8373695-Pyramimonas_sp.AAC.1